MRERHMARNAECENVSKRRRKRAWFGEERKRGHRACVHNEQDELKAERRGMRSIQKYSREEREWFA